MTSETTDTASVHGFDTLGRTYCPFMPVFAPPRLSFERGAGTELWDSHGHRYLDFLSGIAVVSLGHAPFFIVIAGQERVAERPGTARLFFHAHSVYHECVKDPLHGVTLEAIVTALVERYGWEELGARIPIRCFLLEPSVSSSLKFLRRTPWARKKVEALYVDGLNPSHWDE